MAKLSIGALNQRITFQSAVKTSDGAGGKQTTWQNVANMPIWASVTPINGGEVFKAGVLRSTQFYRIELYWRSDITTHHRILWNGQALNIRTCADPDGRRASLLITAESGVAD